MRTLAPNIHAGLKQIKPLRVVVRAVRNLIGAYRPRAWIVEGRERSTGEPLSLFFAGQLESKNYFVQLAFATVWQEIHAGYVWRWSAFHRARRRYPEAGLVVVQMGHRLQRLFTGKGKFFIPAWLLGRVEVPEDPDSLQYTGRLRTDFQRIRRGDFRYEVTTDVAALERFFDDMYVPYVRQIYGDHAFMEQLENLKHWWPWCELIWIVQDKIPVAGQVVYYNPTGLPRAWVLGVRNGSRELVKQGAIAAVYHSLLHRVKAKGCKVVDVGESRPFCRDGVLRYKRRWGMHITGPYRAEPGFLLSCNVARSGVAAFLVNNPFIAEHEGKLVGVVFRNGWEQCGVSELDEFCREYGCPGIAEMHIFGIRRETGLLRLAVRATNLPAMEVAA